MMNEYCINGLTIKENLLRLAGEGNKKFTESSLGVDKGR